MDGAPLLLVETLPEAETVALGAWVRNGSAHEPMGAAGITHLNEHLLLRRCGDRTPEEISEVIDSLGGDVDAFTTRETCAVTAHVPAERFLEALELVLDAVFRPRPEPGDVILEQRVIAAEFDLIQDSPAEVAAERALEACWGEHPLARPVLGRREVVERLQMPDLVRFHRERFTWERLLLVAVGPVDEDRVRERLEGLPDAGPEIAGLGPPAWHSGVLVEERDGLEQLYADLVLPALPAGHPEVLTLGVLNQLLGGGAASRLFRELRERLGLVYDVASSLYTTSVSGVLEITFSAPARQVEECWGAVLRVLEEIGSGRIGEEEVALAKRALAAGIVLGSEGTDALMEAHAGE